ncbi:MAG TPA: MipA/OmpV family protein [Nitrospirota bacterium]|nr:MipA/OmpV family protein [Nitrospirota bacterium]
MKKFILTAAAFFLCCASLSADELPLWEAGFGFTGLSLPDYRGSNQQRLFVLPFPYLVYRGEIFHMDRKGVYGFLFQSDRIQLNISADGGLPVKSNSNTARRGMPNLDPTFQLGPALEICLTGPCTSTRLVQFRVPVRAVFASDFTYLNGIGFVANPQVNLDFTNLGPSGKWNFGCSAGPLYATQQYHEYYYEVVPADSIPGVRNVYRARGGYSGSSLIVSTSRRFEHTWFGAFVRYDNLSGAVFADSPLMRTKQTLLAGFAVAWVFGQSETLVQASP